MKLRVKICISALLCVILAAAFMSGCAKKEQSASKITTIKIGHHYVPEDDPNWTDQITGEHGMSEDNRHAALAALEVVKEKLGVKIEWVSYPSNIGQCLLQSVLAGDPLCHIAVMANATQAQLLSQNILQPLDEYKDIFDSSPDYKWLLLDKCFGHYYLINRDSLYMNNWPLVYNATYIEQVPALRENGQTVYPATLYEQGKWTWGVFEDYLSKINAYFSGRKAPSGKEIYPFHTNYTYTILFALHSNGSCLYDGNRMTFDSEEGKVAAEYLDKLITKGLVCCLKANSKTTDTGYMAATDAFMRGESVFNNAARWRMDNCGITLAERGESMGVIPFPRPDDIAMSDPYGEYGTNRYQIYSSVADSVGLLKGFSKEESRLALEAYALYRTEFYKALGRVDTYDEYKSSMAASKAVEDGVDIFHPVIGDANLRIYEQLGNVPENEFGESMDLMGAYCRDIFGTSVYGVGGAPKYAINVESRKANIYSRLERISKTLNSGDVVDNVVPGVSSKSSNPLVFANGSDPATFDWTKYFTANDNIDGDYELKNDKGNYLIRGKNLVEAAKKEGSGEVPFAEGCFSVDASKVDFNTVGKYEKGIVVHVTDSAGNRSNKEFTAYVYDKANTQPPVLEMKAELKTVDVDAHTETIKWSDFVEKAEDVNAIDLKSRVKADVSMLDVTVKGKYPVVFSVSDFAGNKTQTEVWLEVK